MIKKYLPVWVYEEFYDAAGEGDDVNCYLDNSPRPYDWRGRFKKSELVDSSPYSADELLEVIRKVKDMPCTEVKKLYGEEYYGDLYDKCSASEIIEKYRAYESSPKVGQIWKNKHGGEICIVTRCEENPKEVYLVFRDGSCGKRSMNNFLEHFSKLDSEASTLLTKLLDGLVEVDK